MAEQMTRDDFTWLVVRALGAFMLLLVTLAFLEVGLNALRVMQLKSELMSDSTDPDLVVSLASAYGRTIGAIWALGIEILVKSAFAYYCMYRGKWLQGLLTRNIPSAQLP